MKPTSSYFNVIDIPNEFERFFTQYYLLWETDWIRQKSYLGSSYYSVKGNEATWNNYYSKEHFVLLEYFVNEEAVGYLSYKIEQECIQLEALLLLPEFRGQGLMAQMLLSFYRYLTAERIDCSCIYLETNASNPSTKVYTKLGFKLVEIRRCDRENDEDTWVYRIDKSTKQTVPKTIKYHRVCLIACVILMANPFWVLLLTAVYALLALPYWIHKLPVKNKLWWTFVPICLPWIFWGMIAFFASLVMT